MTTDPLPSPHGLPAAAGAPRSTRRACARAARRAAGAGGFTLLEVVVALAILGTAVAAVLGLLATGVSMTQRTGVRVLATELAESRMEELILAPSGTARGDEGRFDTPYAAFRWRSRVAPAGGGTVLLEVHVVGEGDSVHLATLRAP
jgi:general secretion pathway protein I